MVAALYDRTFMQLSDRGGASNLVGEQWAALCAGALTDTGPGTVPVRTGPDDVVATTTVRLDHIPAIARVCFAKPRVRGGSIIRTSCTSAAWRRQMQLRPIS